MTESIRFDAIGTHWDIDLPHTAPELRERLCVHIKERIAAFDKAYSRFRKDSDIMHIGNAIGTHTLPSDAQKIFDVYKKMYARTNGAFTPFIGNTLVSAGYDDIYSLIPKKELAKTPSWDDACTYAFPNITIKQPVIIDIGAAGKGYIIDIIGKMLEEHHVTTYSIDAGGDIRLRDIEQRHLRIGLENPHNTKEVIGVAEIQNTSICGSAGNRRAWGDFHHIINPHTQSSPKNIDATWVIHEETLIADALATALFFTHAEELAQEYTFHYALLTNGNHITTSRNFPGTFFS